MRGFGFLGFVALTAVSWGLYGPVLHEGQDLLGDGTQKSTLRSLICVGVAYFLIAVLVPLIILLQKGEKGNWTIGGFFWSFFAGAIGALGALGIILAFKFNGTPVFVMPLVFGCAPVMNTIVTMLMNRTVRNASIPFYAGIIIVAIGAVGVLTFKPEKPEATERAEPQHSKVDDVKDAESTEETGKTSVEVKAKDDEPKSKPVEIEKKPAAKGPNFLNLMCVLLTAVCWGAYGPVLHAGQSKMDGSRLRPFLCVGLAYFGIAVIAPYFLLLKFPEAGGWNFGGVFWSLMGGTAGALGALGIIYAFNFGGKPIFVMPLVFGGAPVVNTLSEMISNGLYDQIKTPFYLSLGMVILGAATVLISAPKGHAAPSPALPPKQPNPFAN